MNGEVRIRDLNFSDVDDEDIVDDPDYEPQPSEPIASGSDVSTASSAVHNTTTFSSTDISIPSAIPSDAQPVDDISEIYPDDSISQRNAKLAAQAKHVQSEASESPSVVSFHSSVDDDEHSRLDMQHLALQLHLNSLYASKHLVENALREGQDPPPAVLDVGTGSGRWAIDMALQFPHVDVIGLDLVPPANVAEAAIPPNCRFEVDDANLPFDHYKDCFNVVHFRSADQGINDFESFLYEMAKTLRPNGILLLVTAIPQVYDIDAMPFPVVDEGDPNWLQHTFAAIYTAFENRNNTAVDGSLYWQRWLERNPNYRSPLTRDTFVPLGPIKNDMSEREVFISNLMREDVARLVYAFKPLLIGDGVPEPEVDKCIANTVKELRELLICGYIKWRYTVAIRNTRPWQERMEQPEPLDLPRERLVVKKAEKGSVVTGCSTNITARTSSSGRATVQPAIVTPWPLSVPAGPPRSK
ncbi:hypothetical protein M407DRAFT_17201 [Tulasnella calospora MUT 4182]|uniref:Methyltransferase domain-containing protein n=1 Tax=Tulasnella calospora MUT 4182 TaxID=1051891 RepID=A0A0C3QXU1_9AGAM|nr:hypothetical protein M407DRAFT_17201 [Tulasnella calospora MUT 4182]